MDMVQHLIETHLQYDPKRIASQITKPQAKALNGLAGGSDAVQCRWSVYEINGTTYQRTTFRSLAKAGLVEQIVLVPGDYPTHAYRITKKGRDVASHLRKQAVSSSKGAPMNLTQAAQDVLAERQRQVEKKGWTPAHDDEHEGGELGMAAACYAMEGASNITLDGDSCDAPPEWPWDAKWWKPSPEPRRNLIKAAALLLAEIERLDRATAR